MAASSSSSSLDLAKWDADMDDPEADKQQLYDRLKERTDSSRAPNDVRYLWRLTRGALVLSDLAQKNKSKDKCRAFTQESLIQAKKAIEADPELLESHKWRDRQSASRLDTSEQCMDVLLDMTAEEEFEIKLHSMVQS